MDGGTYVSLSDGITAGSKDVRRNGCGSDGTTGLSDGEKVVVGGVSGRSGDCNGNGGNGKNDYIFLFSVGNVMVGEVMMGEEMVGEGRMMLGEERMILGEGRVMVGTAEGGSSDQGRSIDRSRSQVNFIPVYRDPQCLIHHSLTIQDQQLSQAIREPKHTRVAASKSRENV